MKKKKMNVILFSLCIIICVFIIPGFVEGNSIPQNTNHRIPVVNSKVKIDGMLNEKIWQEALVLELNFEVEPGENIAPPVKTKVFLAYSSDHLYVGFQAYDPKPSEIRAHVTDRDNIKEDDYIGIVLDTFNDSRFAYNFYCNPFGIQGEEITGMIGSGDQWDTIWNSAGHINEEGYVVEIAIPFSSLRFQRQKSEQVWGIDAIRRYPRNLNHLIGLFPRDRSNNCYMCQADKIIGFRGVQPGKNIEVDPTVSSLLTQERESFPGGKFVKKTGKVDPGLTVRWSFTPNLTLSTAINPDFSQVEADAAQLDINSQFALYYPEKRPFFLEGTSIFVSRIRAVYTRAIANPDWGVKITGKEGTHAIGFFSVQDSVTNFLFPGSQGSTSTSIDMNSICSVLRYRKDVSVSSSLGFIITDREGEGYFNRLAAVDGDLKVTKKDRIMFQFLWSQTDYPDQVADEFNQPQGNFSGMLLDVGYLHATKNVQLSGHYQSITPNFRADLGLVRQVGLKYIDVGAGYIWRQNPGHWYTSLEIGTGYSHEMDADNQLLQKGLRGWFKFNGAVQSSFNLDVNFGKKSYMGIEFDNNYLNLDVSLRPAGSLYIRLLSFLGDQIDFANVRAGKRSSLNPILQYKIGRNLFISFDHVFEKLNLDERYLYIANLSNLKLIYQFSRRFFLRTILQFADFKYNTDLYSSSIDPRSRHLFSQVLFAYKVNPQTVLFLGYSDDYYGYSNIPLNQKNRTLFLKIGYALVL
jgi:hypothetical protein